mmetsp:Transcript_7946/g.26285  ORF Transcript_7946/g.26285 Transcript_7946/m.26285 type:complete len:382 (+) Transcript_7946:686-1831(+)
MNPPPKHRARRHNERRRWTIINHTHPPIIIHPTLVFIPNTPFEPVQCARARLNSRQKILCIPPSRTLFPRPDARILPRTIRITKPPFNFINIRPRLARPRAHGGQTFIKISQQPKPRRVALVKVPHRVPFASSLRSRAPVGVGASQRARTNDASFAARPTPPARAPVAPVAVVVAVVVTNVAKVAKKPTVHGHRHRRVHARGADAGTTTRGRVLKLTLINAAGDALAAIERARLTDIGTIDDVRPGVKIAFRRAMTTRVCGAVVVGGDDVRVLGGGADALTKEWRRAAVARATRERDDTTTALASTAPKFHPFDASKEIEIRVSRGQSSAASVSSRLARVEISPPTPPPRATTAANDADGATPIITPRVKPALPPSRAKPP